MTGRISVWGVFVGGVVDVVATNAFNLVVILLWVLPSAFASSGIEAVALMAKAVIHDARLFWAAFAVGGLCSVLGGYVAARIAGRSAVLNGALAAWRCVGLGLWGAMTPSVGAVTGSLAHGMSVPVTTAASIGLTIGLSAFGGWLAHRSRGRGLDV